MLLLEANMISLKIKKIKNFTIFGTCFGFLVHFLVHKNKVEWQPWLRRQAEDRSQSPPQTQRNCQQSARRSEFPKKTPVLYLPRGGGSVRHENCKNFGNCQAMQADTNYVSLIITSLRITAVADGWEKAMISWTIALLVSAVHCCCIGRQLKSFGGNGLPTFRQRR